MASAGVVRERVASTILRPGIQRANKANSHKTFILRAYTVGGMGEGEEVTY